MFSYSYIDNAPLMKPKAMRTEKHENFSVGNS